MSNILFFGDIHGRGGWRKSSRKALLKFYDIVFLGDYVDSFDINSKNQIRNLKDIIAFKKEHPEKVTLLLGNHDYAYIHGFSSISGYQHNFAPEIKSIFETYRDLFDIACGYRSFNNKYTLVTHAGLTHRFWKEAILPEFKEGGFIRGLGVENPDDIEIHEALNYLKDKKDVIWRVGPDRGGYQNPSPIWADQRELFYDPYPGINQIFGHTADVFPMINISGEDSLIRIDAQDGAYLAVTI